MTITQRAISKHFGLAGALLLFALLSIVPACKAQTQFPDTPAGKQSKAFLDAFNAYLRNEM